MAKIISCESVGEGSTYDLEVEHPDHQFYLANGVLTSNSHAVAYSIDSYWCAWLLTYYEPQWLCAYLESMIGNPDKRSRALGELRTFGYGIAQIDVNTATEKWVIAPDKKFMPSFKTVKGIGGKAIEEIMANRPYDGIRSMLWDANGKWRLSKFNKRCLDALIRLGAFESLECVGEGRTFDHYKHMHDVVVGHMDVLKKKGGRDAFDRLVEESRGEDDWTPREKIDAQVELMGYFDSALLIPPSARTKFDELGITPIDEHEGQTDIHWFVLLDTKRKLTKGGKPYQVAQVMGATGEQFRLFVWNTKQETEFKPYTAYFAEINASDFGYGTTLGKMKLLVDGGSN